MSATEEHIQLLRSVGLAPASPEPLAPELEAKLSDLQRTIEAKEAEQRAAMARAAYEAGFAAAVDMLGAAEMLRPKGRVRDALREVRRAIERNRDEMAERFERDLAPVSPTNQEGR